MLEIRNILFQSRPISKSCLKGRHGILIFSCLLFVLFENFEILIEKTNPDILHQIAKSRNPDWILFDYAKALGPVL